MCFFSSHSYFKRMTETSAACGKTFGFVGAAVTVVVDGRIYFRADRFDVVALHFCCCLRSLQSMVMAPHVKYIERAYLVSCI